MSGIEIAGLLLGAIPLLIAALEHYESSLDRATAFIKWRDRLDKTLREFSHQRLLFDMTLRIVLKNIASTSEIETMMTDSTNELWKSKALADSLEQQFRFAYHSYVATIRDMHSCMLRLAAHLDIDRQAGTADELEAIIEANKSLMSSGVKAFHFKRAIKLTMKRKGIQSLLQDMKACNTRLDEFINKSGALYESPTTKRRYKTGLSSSFQQIENYANMLHNTLRKFKCCSSHTSHDVRLFLEDRIIQEEEERSLKRTIVNNKLPTFTISFKSALGSRHWQPAKVEMIDQSPGENTVSATASSKVSFAPEPKKLAKKEKHDNLTAAFRKPPGLANPRAIFHCLPSQTSKCDFGLDASGVLFETPRALSKQICCTENLIGLQDLLVGHPLHKKWKPLADEDRYKVAIILTSSLLQLHSTPWMKRHWNQLEIYFYIHEVGEQLVIDLRNPFVTERYTSNSQSTPPSASMNNLSISFLQNSANLLTLANLLLQIKLHGRVQTQDQGKCSLQLPAFDKLASFQILNQWIVQERGNLSFAYYDAIQFCISSSNLDESDLWNIQFRQVLLDKVVLPLVDEFRHWQGVAN